MARYIDANKARDNSADPYVRIYLDSQPTADVTPAVHANWIKKSHEWDFPPYFYNDFTCSNCGVREQDKAPYCRYCGAKMDEDGDDE